MHDLLDLNQGIQGGRRAGGDLTTNRPLVRVVSAVHRGLYRLSGGLLGANVGAPILLLTTLGRKSQQSRTTPLLYLKDGDHWIIVASNGGDDRHPAWWLNLKANPIAQIQVGRVVNQVQAREATELERNRLWPHLIGMYSVYDDYQRRTSRKIPIVFLEPLLK